MSRKVDWIVVGSGFAGSVTANILAEKMGQKVIIFEERDHIGGNAFDYINNEGILIHKYGPHLFHTQSEKIWNYISKFSEWNEYKHKVIAKFDNLEVPLPVNFNSIETLFGNDAQQIIQNLLTSFNNGSHVPIIKLLESENYIINNFAKIIFEKIFKSYSEKQWGMESNLISKSVLSRVPIQLDRNNYHFRDTFQFLPKNGYTEVFKNLTDHPLIQLELNTRFEPNLHSYSKGIIYTGSLDSLNKYQHGTLPYRSLEFEIENLSMSSFQNAAQVNYTDKTPFTRIIEYKKLYPTRNFGNSTTIVREFPKNYQPNVNIPFYPIDLPENQVLHNKYTLLTQRNFPQLIPLGRLANYKYFNMDQVIAKALKNTNEISADMIIN
jgi:UDP-galactopyranose mutase